MNTNFFIFAGLKLKHGVVVFPQFNNIFLKYIEADEFNDETVEGIYFDKDRR